MSCLLAQRDLLTASLMGFTAGYTTSNTKVRFNTFGGMMTGNTVKIGITLQQGEYAWTGVYLACVMLFALGTIFALFMIQKLGSVRSQHAFLIFFIAAFVLVDGIALAVDDTPTEYNIYASLASSLASFALGAQNLLSQKSGLIKANTVRATHTHSASRRLDLHGRPLSLPSSFYPPVTGRCGSILSRRRPL